MEERRMSVVGVNSLSNEEDLDYVEILFICRCREGSYFTDSFKDVLSRGDMLAKDQRFSTF